HPLLSDARLSAGAGVDGTAARLRTRRLSKEAGPAPGEGGDPGSEPHGGGRLRLRDRLCLPCFQRRLSDMEVCPPAGTAGAALHNQPGGILNGIGVLSGTIM